MELRLKQEIINKFNDLISEVAEFYGIRHRVYKSWFGLSVIDYNFIDMKERKNKYIFLNSFGEFTSYIINCLVNNTEIDYSYFSKCLNNINISVINMRIKRNHILNKKVNNE